MSARIEDALAAPDRRQRQQLLMQIVRSDITNGAAWYHLRETLDDPAQIAECDRRIAATGYQLPAPLPPSLPPAPAQPSLPTGEMFTGGASERPSAPAATPPVATTPMVSPLADMYQPAVRRSQAQLTSLWVWLGLGVAGVLLIAVVAVVIGSRSNAPTVGEGVWLEVTYINNPITRERHTDYVQVSVSYYTRTARGFQLTVLWSVRNVGPRKNTYIGGNKMVRDDGGRWYPPHVKDPPYPLEILHQSYPIKGVYALPESTDMTRLVWARYNDIDDSLTYEIQLSPDER